MTVTTVVNGIKTHISIVWNTIKTVISTVMSAISTTISTVWNTIKANVTAVVNGIKTVITTVWNTIKTVISTVVNTIKTIITTIWNAIKGKTYTVYEKKKRVKKNRGERESYMLEGHHEPIVTPELFDRVQSLMELGLLHSYRSRMTTQERALLRDESWRAEQDRLERKQTGKPIVVKGGYRNGDE